MNINEQLQKGTVTSAPMQPSTLRYSFVTPPPPVGRWHLPGSVPGCGTYFTVAAKPSWLHIKMMKLLLGWKYEEMK